MQTSPTFGMVFAMTVLLWPAFSSGQSSNTAKVCGYLPIPELEAHFGAKAGPVRGSDRPTMSMCGVDLPDRRHGANVISKPPGPMTLTVEQRLAAVRQMLERNGSEIKNFGSVACHTDRLELGDRKVPTVTCSQEAGGYLSLSLLSEDPKHLGFEAAKALLEKAAARRK